MRYTREGETHDVSANTPAPRRAPTGLHERIQATDADAHIDVGRPSDGTDLRNAFAGPGSQWRHRHQPATRLRRGIKVLQDGGNAIDAAVTAAAVLAVVEPTMTGVGGDLFALVFDGRTKTLKGLNSSGRAGSAADADALLADGCSEMPTHGARSVSVPGSVAGWLELLTSHGTIPPARALAPAIRYARDGFPVSEIVAAQWAAVETRLANDPDAARVLLPDGRAPVAGEIFRNADLAVTLEQIAAGGASVMYGGPVGKAIANVSRDTRRLPDERRLRGASGRLGRTAQHHVSRLHGLRAST